MYKVKRICYATIFQQAFRRFFSGININSIAAVMSKYDPQKELPTHSPILFDKSSDNIQYKTSILPNGATVITEESDYPSNIHMGLLINVGARDEKDSSSGSCLALKLSYLNAARHTSVNDNYRMIQMSGGSTEMEYDEENMWYSTHCFDYDAMDMFKFLADAAFEPRSPIAALEAKEKCWKFLKQQDQLLQMNPFGRSHQKMLTTAYGYNTLGMPKWGVVRNINKITAKMLNDFKNETITSDKVIIVANGVKKHDEFLHVVQDSLAGHKLARERISQREKAVYLGGESRTSMETPETNILLAFQGVPWSHPLMTAYGLIHTMFGGAQGFSVGGPGKGMLNRAYRHILRVKYYVSSCESINLHFSDSGTFGFNFTGAAGYEMNVVNDIIETFNGFRQTVSEEELTRSKNILKRSILANLSNQSERVEETAKSYNYFKKIIRHTNYLELIDKITPKDINTAMELALKNKPTLVVTGPNIKAVPSVEEIWRKLK